MKKKLLLVTLVFGHSVWADVEIVKIPLERVFIPSQGYDDNDTIEVTVEGQLPNVCYGLEKQDFAINNVRHEITLQQSAIHQSGEICGDRARDPRLMSTSVPFADTATLGRLAAGDYKIIYTTQLGQQEKTFSVKHATSFTVDSLPYASVIEVSVPPLVQSTAQVAIKVTGLLINTCYNFKDMTAQVVDDVIVVFPTVSINEEHECLPVFRTFTQTVNVGPLQPRRYLVHVRSMQGKSVNRSFSVH